MKIPRHNVNYFINCCNLQRIIQEVNHQLSSTRLVYYCYNRVNIIDKTSKSIIIGKEEKSFKLCFKFEKYFISILNYNKCYMFTLHITYNTKQI